MALQRRLVVGLGTVSSLLLVYLLCVRLESPVSFPPHRNLQLLHNNDQRNGSRSEEDSVSTFGPGPSSRSLQRTTSGRAAEHGPESTTLTGNKDKSTTLTGNKDKSTTLTGNKDKSTTPTRTKDKSTTTAAATTPPTDTATTKPGLKPTKPGLKPTKPGLKRTKPGLKPTKPGLKPTKPGLKPTKPGFKPEVRPKPGPTEPPFIGDSYFTEETPPLTDCPDAVRRLVPQTDFSTRFRSDVPVLQWSKHVTKDQYDRLKQYPGAHGWGGLTYDTLVETLSVLDVPHSALLLDDWSQRLNASRCIRCAVVGNGGILKDSGKGQEIDKHHYIFRTNGAIIKGFEADVGSRTTHYTFSTNTLRNSLRSYGGVGYSRPPQSQETRYVFLPDHDRDYLLMKAAATHSRVDQGPERGMDPTEFFGKDVTKEKLKMYHPDFIRYLRNRFLRSNALKTKYKDIYRPSTGAVMLLAALHTCDQVSAYGFMTPDYSQYSDHYYDKTHRPVGFFINHDLRMEMNLWQQLHKAGLIRLYMHQDQGPQGPQTI